jgi:hypothetical protein
MMKASTQAAVLAMTLMLSACNQTGAGSAALGAATALDPTGLSGAVVSMAESIEPEARSQRVDFSLLGPRLSEVAAGNTAGPDYMREFDRHASQMMAEQAGKMTVSAGHAAVEAALTGGLSLPGSASNLAMQGLSSGALAAQLAAARGHASADVAKAQAQRAAMQLVPDADRPAEARAILSLLDHPGESSATWHNPATGASGRVGIMRTDPEQFNGMDCRLLKRELKTGNRTRTDDMLACRSGGEWYDLS